jgi:hypothetical protein
MTETFIAIAASTTEALAKPGRICVMVQLIVQQIKIATCSSSAAMQSKLMALKSFFRTSDRSRSHPQLGEGVAERSETGDRKR